MEDFIDDNREHWEELAELHPETDHYDVEGFLEGGSTLDPIEPEELGAVDGKSLLHLQCHIGLDTLSWARRGADVTGVDISSEAIDVARELAAEAELDHRARFVRSDVYDLADDSPIAAEEFDVVYSSFGVLFWRPDLDEWADTVVQFVREGARSTSSTTTRSRTRSTRTRRRRTPNSAIPISANASATTRPKPGAMRESNRANWTTDRRTGGHIHSGRSSRH